MHKTPSFSPETHFLVRAHLRCIFCKNAVCTFSRENTLSLPRAFYAEEQREAFSGKKEEEGNTCLGRFLARVHIHGVHLGKGLCWFSFHRKAGWVMMQAVWDPNYIKTHEKTKSLHGFLITCFCNNHRTKKIYDFIDNSLLCFCAVSNDNNVYLPAHVSILHLTTKN